MTISITNIVLNNYELEQISREPIGALRPVRQADLLNPDVVEFARMCGGQGFRVEDPDDLEGSFATALAVEDGPSPVEVVVSSHTV